jgi:serine/threonine protein kinase
MNLWIFATLCVIGRVQCSLNRYTETLADLRAGYIRSDECELLPLELTVDLGDGDSVIIDSGALSLITGISPYHSTCVFGEQLVFKIHHSPSSRNRMFDVISGWYLNERAILETLHQTLGTPRSYRIESSVPVSSPSCLSRILVMDYVGVNLERLSSEGRLSLRRVYRIARDALEIIRRYHTAGFIHGDIQASNFVLDGQNRLTLIDYETTSLYIDPSTGDHLPAEDGSLISLSRGVDMRGLSSMLILLVPDSLLVVPAIFEAFNDSTRYLDFSAVPDYGWWRNRFQSHLQDII